MKAFTPDDLQSILDTELVWRRREISSLVTLTKTAPVPSQPSMVRAIVPLLYAHWEGFGRESFIRYLEFVSYRRVKFKNLNPAFLYLASSPSLAGFAGAGVRSAIETVEGFLNRLNATNKDSYRKRVITRSNLRSDVLQDLLLSCGLDATEFENDADFIDRDLCDSRNEIAHGSSAGPTLDAFLKRRDRAFALMSQLQAAVVNAAINQTFKAVA